MATVSLRNIGLAIKAKRGDYAIRETAKEIGISSATLSRIENGKLPDLETFSKLCQWLKVDGGQILGCSISKQATATKNSNVSFHLKADKNLTPETSSALAKMILAAQEIL